MNCGKWMCLFSYLLVFGCTAPHYFWPQRDIGFRETNPQTMEKKILIASRDSAFKRELVDRITAAYSNRPIYIRTTGIEALADENANDYSAVVLITTCMGWTVDVEVERFLTRYGHLSSIIVLTTSNGGDVLPDMENRKIDAISSASVPDRAQPLAQKLIAKINRLIE